MRGLLDRVKALLRKAVSDDITGEAAKVAFFLFLALFPLILVLFSLTGLLGGEETFAWVMSRLRTLLPSTSAEFLEGFVREVTTEEHPGALSVGAVLLLWAASTGVVALTDGLNAMYEIRGTRSWLRKRGLSLLLVVALSVLLTSGATLVVAGPDVADRLGIGFLGTLAGWVAAYGLLLLLLWLLYYFLPHRDQAHARRECFLGAAVGSLAWLGATGLFRLYVSNVGSYADTYGFVGAVIVLLLWLYVTAMAILLGGEVAAMLERRGERVPTE